MHSPTHFQNRDVHKKVYDVINSAYFRKTSAVVHSMKLKGCIIGIYCYLILDISDMFVEWSSINIRAANCENRVNDILDFSRN